MRGVIRKQNQKLLPFGYDVDTHFKPRYDPWDQRLCLVPDGNLFLALRSGTAEIVTDTVDTFTETGLRLASGRELDADIVVTATGLNLMLFGGIELTVDGVKPDLREQIAYKALMLSGLPNFAFTIGYTNASWTLKADLVAEYVCRLLDHLDEHGHRSVVPVPDPEVQERPFLDFTPGYVLRSLDIAAQAGPPRALAAAAELSPRRPHDPARGDRRRRPALRLNPPRIGPPGRQIVINLGAPDVSERPGGAPSFRGPTGAWRQVRHSSRLKEEEQCSTSPTRGAGRAH